MGIPKEQRITHYFGDYGDHFFNQGVTEEEISKAYHEALDVIEMEDWSYVKKKYKLNMNSILIFLIMPLQFRVSSILSSNFSHVCSAIRNYNDYEPLPCYKMSRYIQIQAYMHAYNPLF